MEMDDVEVINCQRFEINSDRLKRTVLIDLYQPENLSDADRLEVLLINDGQDLLPMKFSAILEALIRGGAIAPLVCIGIHAGVERLKEYGVIGEPDYKGRGSEAHLYCEFILEELIPACAVWLHTSRDSMKLSISGFSLGGLSALDLAWKHPDVFHRVAAFSGAFWWRNKDQHDPAFDESKHLIMHRKIREKAESCNIRFFFEAGTDDETADRNKNGVIDSIDDTLSLIDELKRNGVQEPQITYLQIEGGKHDLATWASAFPAFLTWGWGQSA